MKGTKWVVLCLLLGGVLPTVGAEVETSSPGWTTGSEPLHVDSQSLEARGKEGIVVFQGDVVVRQGDLTVHADRVEVKVQPETREIGTVEAQGNVRIEKGQVAAVGDRATYDAHTGVVVLMGEPKVWRGRDVVAGHKITLYLMEDRSVVEGAKAVLFPGDPGDPEGR